MEKSYSFAEVSIEESIDRMVNEFGIEGAEQEINRILGYLNTNMCQLKETYLTTFYKRFPFLK